MLGTRQPLLSDEEKPKSAKLIVVLDANEPMRVEAAVDKLARDGHLVRTVYFMNYVDPEDMMAIMYRCSPARGWMTVVFSTCTVTLALLEQLRTTHGESVRRIHFLQHSAVSVSAASALGDLFPSLECLYMNSTYPLGSHEVKAVSKMKSLRVLWLANLQRRPLFRLMAHLSKLPRLEKLTIADSTAPAHADMLSGMQTMSKLRSITFVRCTSLHDAVFCALGKQMPCLSRLQLFDTSCPSMDAMSAMSSKGKVALEYRDEDHTHASFEFLHSPFHAF